MINLVLSPSLARFLVLLLALAFSVDPKEMKTLVDSFASLDVTHFSSRLILSARCEKRSS